MILVGLVSGGMDSATAFADAINKFNPDVKVALTVVYGQRHARELKAAAEVAKVYGAQHLVVDLSDLFEKVKEVSALLGGRGVPEAEELVPGLVPPTYVPQRNAVLLASAGAILEKLMIERNDGLGVISVGFHGTDYAPGEPVYPDTRPEFVEAMERALNEGSSVVFNFKRAGREAKITIYAPFVRLKKKDVVKRALELGVPLELTWTCYRGGDRPCGTCPACVSRLRAFMEAGVPDPLTESYERLPEWYVRWLRSVRKGR